MDCETFFATVDRHLADLYDRPSRTTTGGQCVVDFYHPRVVATFGTEGLVTRFNRSGIVWAPPDRLRVQLRVPESHETAVADALAAGPFPAEVTDHRGASTPDGEMVTILHYAIREAGVSNEDLESTLDAVATALEV